MTYIDEQIALLERKSRMLEAEEILGQPEGKMGEGVPSPEEMLDAVRMGNVTFPSGETHDLEVKAELGESFPMVLLKDAYTDVEEGTEMAAYISGSMDISQIAVLLTRPMEEESTSEWKERFVTGMRERGTPAKVEKEKTLEHLDYLVFRSLTEAGKFYGLVFRIWAGNRRVIGSYNCRETQRDTYGVMLEAFVLRTNELLADGEQKHGRVCLNHGKEWEDGKCGDI